MKDDLISRQAAIEYFMTNTNWHDEDGYPIDDAEEKRKLLEDYFNGISSAEPSCSEIPKKTGHWITNEDYDGEVYYTCSRCEEPWVTIDGTPQENRMKYCPQLRSKDGRSIKNGDYQRKNKRCKVNNG